MNVPALRQSIYESMACESGYKLVHIDGVRFPDTEPGDRGTDVHAIHAAYAEHCARKRVPADFVYLDSLCKAAGEEVAQIMETSRDSLSIDWANFFGAEISFGLDEDFHPTFSYDHDGARVFMNPVWGETSKRELKDACYCGIMDLVYILPGGKVAQIVDLKSHPRLFPADTTQGKMYCLALMMHMPELQEVEFSLRFVRYANAVTTKKYFRSDVPDLMDNMRRARARQVAIHEKVANQETLRAHGGAHCTYCPCTLNPVAYPCPIMKLNPNLNMRPEERLNWKLVYGAMAAVNDKVLHQLVDGSGLEIYSQDANGKVYKYGPKESTETTAPLFVQDGKGGFAMPILDALMDWANANPKDLILRKGSQPWFCNLRIGWSQLKSYLKANKREIIHNRIKDLVTVKTTVEYGITKEPEVDDGVEEKKPWDASGPDELEF
jgi:hypothetical protein